MALTFLKNGELLADFPYDHRIGQMMEDTDKSLWVSLLDNGGIRHYATANDLKTGRFESFLQGKSVDCLLHDRSGGFWATSLQDGIFYSPKIETTVFNHFKSAKNEQITAIETVGDSVLFFSTFDGNIYQIRPPGQVAEALPFQAKQILDLCWLPSQKALFTISNRESWFFKNGRQQIAKDEFGEFRSKRANLSQDGKTMFLPTGGGFLHFNLVSGQRLPDSKFRSKIPIRTLDICQDHLGHTWVGTLDGLFLFENQELVPAPWSHPALRVRIDDIENYPFPNQNSTLPSLVVATRGQGIFLILGDSIRQFTTDDGLVSNMFERVHVAPDGVIWAAGLLGLSRISRRADGTFRIRNYSVEQGLPSNEVNDVATFCGQTWVATAAGLVRLAPDVESEESPMPFQIEVFVNGKLTKSPALASLAHDQNNLEIRFKTLNFKMFGHIPYRYWLSVDWLLGNWLFGTNNQFPNNQSTITQLTSANFSSLAPGKYIFQVQSQNEDEKWSPANAVQFEIRPPWWQTGWFRLLVFLSFCGAGFWFYRLRTNQLKKDLATKQQLFDLERRALQAQMNPHFIFNCLTSIQNFISEGDKESAMRYTARFAKLTRSVLNFSGKNTIALEDEIETLELYLDLERLRTSNRLEYKIEVAPGIDAFETELPPMLVQPFVENAIKHGKISRLDVIFSQSEGHLVATVRDDGIGLTANLDKLHQSKGIEMTRQRLAIWNENDQPENLKIENLEKGVLITIRIRMQ